MRKFFNEYKTGLGWIAFIIAVLIIMVFGCKTQYKWDSEKYNEGVCVECGGVYEFSGGSGRSQKEYYYTCNECDHTIIVYNIME